MTINGDNLSNYFICLKVRICTKLKPKAYNFKKETALNEKMNTVISTAWKDDSESWIAGL